MVFIENTVEKVSLILKLFIISYYRLGLGLCSKITSYKAFIKESKL